jgi:hypothetical protein
MIDRNKAENFAQFWIKAWNDHSTAELLDLYADAAEVIAPFMLRTLGCSDGLVQGRDNLRRIFEGAFELYPDLKFELLEVTPGEESLVLNYRGLGSMYTSEVMTLNSEGKITRSMASYTPGR